MSLRSISTPLRRAGLAAAATACLLLAPVASAIVDDAHSMAITLAEPQIKKGFRLRADYWHGEAKGTASRVIKHQLFKGNEYWFWLGCDVEGAKLTLQVLDATGRAIQSETASGTDAIGVRVLPPKTGSYTIQFSVTLPDGKSDFGWAVAYGYR